MAFARLVRFVVWAPGQLEPAGARSVVHTLRKSRSVLAKGPIPGGLEEGYRDRSAISIHAAAFYRSEPQRGRYGLPYGDPTTLVGTPPQTASDLYDRPSPSFSGYAAIRTVETDVDGSPARHRAPSTAALSSERHGTPASVLRLRMRRRKRAARLQARAQPTQVKSRRTRNGGSISAPLRSGT